MVNDLCAQLRSYSESERQGLDCAHRVWPPRVIGTLESVLSQLQDVMLRDYEETRAILRDTDCRAVKYSAQVSKFSTDGVDIVTKLIGPQRQAISYYQHIHRCADGEYALMVAE